MARQADREEPRRKYVGLGWIVCDEVMRLPYYPPEDKKAEAELVLTQVGGPAVRALLLLQRFGCSTKLIGAIGDDPAGRQMLTELGSHGVDTTLVRTDTSKPTRLAHVWLAAATGSRTIAYSPIGPDLNNRFDKTALDSASGLLLDGRHLAVATSLAAEANAAKIPVAVDMGGFKDGITALVTSADIVIGPERTWANLAGELGYPSPLDVMLHLDATCVLTSGPDRVLATEVGQVFEHYPRRVTAVDSNGAGDVFFGAFVWATGQSYSLGDAVRFAAAAAAAKCQWLGNSRLPSLDDILPDEAASIQ